MSQPQQPASSMGVRLGSPQGRGLITAAILGSGVAFLDGSVVNVALPTIGRDLGGGFAVLQWVLDGYLLTLSALLLLGGALGDRYGRRRVFVLGLAVFTVASLACGLAPDGLALIIARLAQGVGGALLVPGSLALIDAAIPPTSPRSRCMPRSAVRCSCSRCSCNCRWATPRSTRGSPRCPPR